MDNHEQHSWVGVGGDTVLQAQVLFKYSKEYFNKIVYLEVHRRHPLINREQDPIMSMCQYLITNYCLNCNSVSNMKAQVISTNFPAFPLVRNNLLYRNSNSLLSEFTYLLIFFYY